MTHLKPDAKLYAMVLLAVSTFLMPSTCFSAWPFFEAPAADPKAHRSIVYSSDMTILRYFKYHYDSQGNLLKKVEYDSPGEDGTWFSNDDGVGYSVEVNFYDAANRKTMEVSYYSEGPDGVPLTGDDLIGNYEKYLYDGNGDIYRRIQYYAAGNDGAWLNADDRISHYTDYIYDYDRYFIRDIRYAGPGPDGTWFSADDLIEEYDDNYFHSNFRQYFEEDFDGAGADGRWFNSDDVKREQDEYLYDGNWNLSQYIQTKTDGEVDETTFQYDSRNNCTRQVHQKNGAVVYYGDFVYDQQNRLKQGFQYFSPGADGIWFTSDDPWTAKVVFDFTPASIDTDSDGLPDEMENRSCTDPYDADSDDDGIADGNEDANQNALQDAGETDPCQIDTDSDGIQDGTEVGVTLDRVSADTDLDVFIADEKPSTTTDPLDFDSDDDGISDGEEDINRNGALDAGETDPAVSNRSKAMPWIPLLLLGDTSSNNKKLYVPSGFSTIQSAIDAAVPGDTVIVSDGVYTGVGNKNLDFKGKSILVTSMNGPAACIIDCEKNGRAFYFHNNENAQAVVSGFTIKNGLVSGQWPDGGGAIACHSASPLIEGCLFIQNKSYEPGGAIFLSGSSAVIRKCVFSGNSAHAGGAVIAYESPKVKIVNCLFDHNIGANIGGAFDIHQSTVEIVNSTFTRNTGDYGAGGIWCSQSTLKITNSLIWENEPNGLELGMSCSAEVNYSNVQDGFSGNGNLNQDPKFASDSDYRLLSDSPCIDTGTAAGAPDSDIEGLSRPFGTGYDIGAYEYHN